MKCRRKIYEGDRKSAIYETRSVFDKTTGFRNIDEENVSDAWTIDHVRYY